MNITRLIVTGVITASLLTSTILNAAGNSSPKKQYSKTTYSKSDRRQAPVARTKEYVVPGSAAIGIAKQHGYLFPSRAAKTRVFRRNGKTRRYRTKGTCKFMGMHWQVDAGKECPIMGFVAPRSKPKCKVLRKGWKIKEIKLQGSYVWSERPVNTSEPLFTATSKNASSKVKAVTIKTVTLIGPEGPFNKFEEAFNHCSQSNYQP